MRLQLTLLTLFLSPLALRAQDSLPPTVTRGLRFMLAGHTDSAVLVWSSAPEYPARYREALLQSVPAFDRGCGHPTNYGVQIDHGANEPQRLIFIGINCNGVVATLAFVLHRANGQWSITAFTLPSDDQLTHGVPYRAPVASWAGPPLLVRGTVRDTLGHPVGGVWIWPAQTWTTFGQRSWWDSLRTGLDGQFAIRFPSPGVYVVSSRRGDHEGNVISLTLPEDTARHPTLALQWLPQNDVRIYPGDYSGCYTLRMARLDTASLVLPFPDTIRLVDALTFFYVPETMADHRALVPRDWALRYGDGYSWRSMGDSLSMFYMSDPYDTLSAFLASTIHSDTLTGRVEVTTRPARKYAMWSVTGVKVACSDGTPPN